MEKVKKLENVRITENKMKTPGTFKRELPLLIMLIPGVILVLIYSYGSMVGTVIAFQKFNIAKGLFRSEWIGFDNFRNLFSMPNIGPIIRNTVVIALGKMIGGILVPVLFALMLNEVAKNKLKRTFQTMVYLPHFLSWVILASIFTDILSPSSGIVNKFLGFLGVEPIFFLGSTTWFPITMIITDIWKVFGFGSIIYLAADFWDQPPEPLHNPVPTWCWPWEYIPAGPL